MIHPCLSLHLFLPQFLAIILAFLVSSGENGDPVGATGCSTQWKQGGCWRFCKGTSGLWCYTGSNCLHNQESCAYNTKCPGHSCDGGSTGCVKHCPDDNQPKTISPPHGSTGCSKTRPEGTCWRFCSGSSGNWCYTRYGCVNDEESCGNGHKDVSQCAIGKCDGASEGCVEMCPGSTCFLPKFHPFDQPAINARLKRSSMSFNSSFISTQELRRSKRFPPSYFEHTSCSDLMTEYRKVYSENTEMSSDKTHPVVGVTYAGRWDSQRRLPLIVRAKIVGKNGGRRSTFGTQLNDQFHYLQRWPGDEKGHLIDSQLEGPAEWWNLAPLTPTVNRHMSAVSSWWHSDNAVGRFLENNCGFVDWNVILNYKQHERRPSALKLCYAVYDNNGNVIRGPYEAYFDNLE